MPTGRWGGETLVIPVGGGMGDWLQQYYFFEVFRKLEALHDRLGFRVVVRAWALSAFADPRMFERNPWVDDVELYQGAASPPPKEPADRCYEAVLASHGIRLADLPDSTLEIPLNAEERARQAELLAALPEDRPHVVFHPFQSSPKSCATPRFWAELAALVTRDCSVVLFGHPKDLEGPACNQATWEALQPQAISALSADPWYVKLPLVKTAAFGFCNESSIQNLFYACGRPSLVFALSDTPRDEGLKTRSSRWLGRDAHFHMGCLRDPVRHRRLLHSKELDPWLALYVAKDILSAIGEL